GPIVTTTLNMKGSKHVQAQRRRWFMRRGMAAAVVLPAMSLLADTLPAAAAPANQQFTSPTLDAIRSKGQLNIGSTLQFKPEMFRDATSNQPMGYDIDLVQQMADDLGAKLNVVGHLLDRKSTRLNSSHVAISYAVFCLKK